MNLSDSFIYLWNKILFISKGQGVGFCSTQLALWKMRIHFIAIKICVVSLAVCVVKPQHFFSRQDSGPVSLDGGSVKSGLAVQQKDISVFNVSTYLQENFGCCL